MDDCLTYIHYFYVTVVAFGWRSSCYQTGTMRIPVNPIQFGVFYVFKV